jgi:hypothetical protein
MDIRPEGAEAIPKRQGEFHDGTHFITIHPLPSKDGKYLVGKCIPWHTVLEVEPHFYKIQKISERIKDLGAWKQKISRAKANKRQEPLNAILRIKHDFKRMIHDGEYHADAINEILTDKGYHVFHYTDQESVPSGKVFSKIPSAAKEVSKSELKRIKQMLKNEDQLGDLEATKAAEEIWTMLNNEHCELLLRTTRPYAKRK